MRKLDIALVGCGGIANAHVNGYQDLYTRGLKIFNIKATCDILKENAKTKAQAIAQFQRTKPRIYTQLEDMLSVESLDAVDLCLPHNVHHTIAFKCLEKGLDVFIEKPLGVTMRAAKKIIDKADKLGRVLAVAENYRRSPENRAIWWAIRQGMIGKPRMILWTAASWRPRPWGWREDKLIAGGSWVFDGGVHYADADRYHLGAEAVKVYAVNHTFHPVKDGVKVTVDDMTMGIIQYENDVYVQWLWTKAAPAKDTRMRVIYGSKGAITGGEVYVQKENHTNVYKMRTIRDGMTKSLKPEQLERWFPKGATNTFTIELYDFYDSVINGRKPEVDGLEAYRDMAIPLGMYESAMLERAVSIQDVEELRLENYQKEINEKLGI
jgi:predicted dehydrogenase